MSNKNSVIFKGNKNGITVMLDNTLDFNDIKYALNKKVADAKKFFGHSNTSILFKGRELSENEEEELLKIISHNTNLNISFVNNERILQNTDIEANKNISKDNVKTIDDVIKISSMENNTIFNRGSLRSGQKIEHKGSIVVIGDINPGAELVACKNIIVLGSLRGFAHAGCEGDSDSFVVALDLLPTQLRIANIITYIPKEHIDKTKPLSPSLAYIQEGQIYIEPLV